MKILTIGGATQDVFIESHGSDRITLKTKFNQAEYMLFESGEKVEVTNLNYLTGGGSNNSAVSFKRLGFDSSCFCKVGNDNAGKHIINNLEKEMVNTKKIIQSEKHPSGTSFIINSIHGERTIFAHRGANGHLKKEEIPFEQIKNSNLIYITSLSHNSSQLLPDIVSVAKKNNIPITINPGISQLTKGTITLKNSLKDIDTFIINSTEAKQFMIALIETDENYKKLLESSLSPNTSNTQEEVGKNTFLMEPILYENIFFSIYKFFIEILKMGPTIIVVTDGSNGVYVATKKEILFHPSIKTKVIDTVGAGDSFGSCFAASLAQKYSIEDALLYGLINSSSVISKTGAQTGLLTFDEIKNKAKQIDKKLLQRHPLYK